MALAVREASARESVSAASGDRKAARRVVIGGRVQGVGYRPFVLGLARRYGLSGTVQNHGTCVLVHVEGPETVLAHFLDALARERPAAARPLIEASAPYTPLGYDSFRVLQSVQSETVAGHLSPDLSLCEDCRIELEMPQGRRYRYPFIACTQCGPRYTVIRALPYDRPRTSMSRFTLCEDCRAEYQDPDDRHFHAEALGCAHCGPPLRFVVLEPRRNEYFGNATALRRTVSALRHGEIVAVKGVGGYHLMCDASSDAAVEKLRRCKRRPTKPLAVMFPITGEDGLESVLASVALDCHDIAALTDPVRPIVLARRRVECPLSHNLAPGLDTLGVLLPYSPLHNLIASDFGAPVVATSGNVSGAPVIIDAGEAEHYLAGIASAFLHHDRVIERPADDPIIRVSAAEPRVIRFGRGNAPAELKLPAVLTEPVLAVGGHLKATLGIGFGNRAVISPHIGDLDDARSRDLHARLASELPTLYGVDIKRLACDAHPDYASARWARHHGLPLHVVQHHAAHASALAGAYPEIERWLVFTWDGSGFGDDGTMWGGEALLGRPGDWRRVASFRPFRLPGGDRAAREPWRSAAALMWEIGQRVASPLHERETELVRRAWECGLNSTVSSSIGRIFDAAGFLVTGLEFASYEGEAAMHLEALAGRFGSHETPTLQLPMTSDRTGVLRSNWAPLLSMLANKTMSAPTRAFSFHATLAETILAQTRAIAAKLADDGQIAGFDAVGLTGGVFQNRLLSELSLTCLERAGIAAYLPSNSPVNDAGLAYGQLVEAAAVLAGEAPA